MTALAEATPETAAEVFFAGVGTHRPATARQAASAPRLTVVGPPHVTTTPTSCESRPASSGGPGLAGAGVAERPRVRLVPALAPVRPRTATAPPAGRPPTLAERIRVLRIDDRSLEPDEGDDSRGAAPEADPSLVARRLAGASVEVIAGRRPAAQLARWLAPGVLDVLRNRAALTRHTAVPVPGRPPAVRGVRVCILHEHLVEATAVVDDGRRVRAIALRLEAHRGAWRATALEVG